MPKNDYLPHARVQLLGWPQAPMRSPRRVCPTSFIGVRVVLGIVPLQRPATQAVWRAVERNHRGALGWCRPPGHPATAATRRSTRPLRPCSSSSPVGPCPAIADVGSSRKGAAARVDIVDTSCCGEGPLPPARAVAVGASSARRYGTIMTHEYQRTRARARTRVREGERTTTNYSD